MALTRSTYGVPVVEHLKHHAGRPNKQSPEAMAHTRVANVIARLSPALRMAAILALWLGLRKGETLGLDNGHLWMPGWDRRPAIEWLASHFIDPFEKALATSKFEKQFGEEPLPEGFLLVEWQRMMTNDPYTGELREEMSPVKTTDSFALLGFDSSIKGHVLSYGAEFHPGYDSSDAEQRKRLFVRSMSLEANGGYGIPSYTALSAAVKSAMKAEGYTIDLMGHRCGLHLLRESLGGWLEDTNAVSGRAISDTLRHAQRRPEKDPEERPAEVTERIYIPSMNGRAIRRVAMVTEEMISTEWGSLERFEERPLRLGESWVVSDVVAERLGVTLSSVAWMARTGLLVGTKTWIAGYPTQRWAIEAASLEAYEKAHSEAELRPQGTSSALEVAVRLEVSDRQVTLLWREGRLEGFKTAAGLRIFDWSVEEYRQLHFPEGTVSFGAALALVNERIKVSAKRLHKLCESGVIRAARRPKGSSGYWLRPYRDSVEEYLVALGPLSTPPE